MSQSDTAIEHQQKGTLPNVETLLERYKTACDLKQTVDREKITAALHRWWSGISLLPMRIRFADNSSDYLAAARAARAAWAAWAAWAARPAWAARAAWDAWDARAARAARPARAAWDARPARAAWDARAARPAWAAWAAWDARAARAAWAARDARAAWDAWAARAARAARDAWEMSWISITCIGAAELQQKDTLQKWLGFFEAFEAGAFCLHVCADELVVCTNPTVVEMDDSRRLHCATGPAFRWLENIEDYYWHGVRVKAHVVTAPEKITAEEISAEQDAEVKLVLIERSQSVHRFPEGNLPH